MRASAILFFIFFFQFAYSQNIDSLKNVVNATEESQKFEVILGYMRSLLNSSAEQSYNVSEYALKFAEEKSDSLLITKTLFAQGFILRRLSKEGQAEVVLNRAYGISVRNNFFEELSKVLNLLAIIYTYTGRYDDALRTNFEALTVNEKRNNLEDVSISCNNIGIAYFRLRNYEEALKYYQKSLDAKSKAKSTFDLDRLYINMALCYNQLDNFEEAEKSIKYAFDVCKGDCSDEIIMEAEFAFGLSLLERGKANESLEHFNTSLEYAKKLKSSRFEIEILSNLGEAYLVMQNTKEALAILKIAESNSTNTEYLQSLLDLYEKFSDYYSETNDYQNAAYYSRKYSDLRDSVLSERLIKNLADVQSKFAERENLATITTKDQTIKQQRYISTLITITVILCGLLILFVMRINRITRRLNSKLSEEVQKQTAELVVAKAKLEKSNKSLRYVNAELDNLIYKTSHDLKGPLTTLKGICNVAMLDVKDALANDYLKKIDSTSDKLNKVLDRLSVISFIMSAVHDVEEIDLGEFIEEIVNTESKIDYNKNIQIIKNLSSIEDFRTDKKMLKHALECLINNAFKYHNDSSRVDSYVKIVTKLQDANTVCIQVIDNGIGMGVDARTDVFRLFFRASERSETGGTGLFIAKLATEKLQGDIEFFRHPTETEFRILLPRRLETSESIEPDFSKHALAPREKAI